MIPQIIHYCWFGKNPIPDMAKKCIDSWKVYFPDWEIVEWNEDNYDITKYRYCEDAYELKKWAFVSDVARLDVLYEYGGIYLDIDVEFIKPLPKEYLNYKGICGFECTGIIAPGLIFGVEKNNEFVKEILDSYKNERFVISTNGFYNTINLRINGKFEEAGLISNNKYQIIEGFHVFPSEFFCGYDTDIREPDITENTICWHHYLGSWSSPSTKMKLQDLLKKVIGKKLYKKLLLLIRKMRK